MGTAVLQLASDWLASIRNQRKRTDYAAYDRDNDSAKYLFYGLQTMLAHFDAA